MRAVKKPRPARAHNGNSSRFTALPQSLVEIVVAFLADEDTLDVKYGHVNWKIVFEPMARVSKDWYALADEVASRRVLQYVRAPTAAQRDACGRCKRRSHVLAMRHQLILQRGHVQRLVVDALPDYGGRGVAMWVATLRHAPTLTTIEFKSEPSDHWPIDRVTDLTRAAAQCCPLLVTLTLPISLGWDEDIDVHRHSIQALSNAVCDGVQVWSQRGGLRRLRLPMYELMKTGQDATHYLDTLIQYCPRIQCFDGFKPRWSAFRDMAEQEGFWHVDLPTWDRFCRGCDELEVFEWRCVPFATRFFEVFGAHAKPKLRKLVFSVSRDWNWNQYLETVSSTTADQLETTGFGDLAVRPESALRATPNLETLRIAWDNVAWDVDTLNVNPAIFGDAFVEAVAVRCPNLSELTYAPVNFDGPNGLATFTGRSLRALSTLACLQSVSVEGGNFTGDGLFDLVADRAARTARLREYLFCAGDNGDDATFTSFYSILERFLERLVAHSFTQPWQTRRVSLRLCNLDERASRRCWNGNSPYWRRVQQLMDDARTLHPWLLVRMLLHVSVDSGDMKRVDEFVFATDEGDGVDLPQWGDVYDVDVSADGVFFSRPMQGGTSGSDDSQ